MSKGLSLGISVLAEAAATLAVTTALSMDTAIIRQAFAIGGGCTTCASLFTPKSLSSGLSDTGTHSA